MAQKKNSRGSGKKEAKPQSASKNGKKDGGAGSSFFTWFMVLALLGVWTSVAVVWFDLVDYDDVLARAKEFRYNISEVLQGKLGAYDADGDGDFDVEDAKVLLGLTKDGGNENSDSLEEVLDILAEEGSDWFYGFLTFLYDVITPFERPEDEDSDSDEDVGEAVSEAAVPKSPKPKEEISLGVATPKKSKPKEEISVEAAILKKSKPKEEISVEAAVTKKSKPKEEAAPVEVQMKVQVKDEEPGEVAKKKPKGLKEAPMVVVERETLQEPFELPVEEPEAEFEPEPAVAEEVIQPSVAEEAAQPPPEPVEEQPLVMEEVEEVEPEEEEEAAYEAEEVEDPEEQIFEEELEEEEVIEEETAPEEEEEEEPVEEPEEAEVESAFVEEEAAEDSPSDDEGEVQDTAVGAESEDDVDGSQSMDVESEIQAAVPLPELVEEDLDPEDNTEDFIDSVGEIVEDAVPEETVEEYQEESAPEESHLTEEADLETESVNEEEEEEELPQEELLEVDQGDESVEEDYPQEEAEEEEVAPTEYLPVDESPEEPVQAEDRDQDESAGAAEAQQDEKPKEKAKKKKPKLLNKFDKTIKAEIDAAEKLRKKGKVEEALRAFESLVQRYPQSPRSRYGKAQSEDDMAEKKRSNEMLLTAISTYREASELADAPEDLVKATLKKRAERQQFLGRLRGALATLERLVQIFPEDVSLKNDLGVAYLLMGDNKNAKKVYEEVLATAPDDGFAKVHYGFILKSDNKIAESIPFLREGLESGDPGTDDGRFYFHLGDALQRVGDASAYDWYELGHQRGHFASVWQRSLYNVDGLKAQAWWTARETGYTDLIQTLERSWKTIRDEALSLMDATRGLFAPEDENLREKGEWGQFTLWQQGKKVENSCRSVPKTCALLERHPEATGCKRGQIKYSVMQPGTHVWPHTGPTNCRLRMHLGLVIPPKGCSIRCTNQTRSWEEGRVLIFDDSFEHEVWQDAASYRLIFIVDVWHPQLTQHQRQTLSPI